MLFSFFVFKYFFSCSLEIMTIRTEANEERMKAIEKYRDEVCLEWENKLNSKE